MDIWGHSRQRNSKYKGPACCVPGASRRPVWLEQSNGGGVQWEMRTASVPQSSPELLKLASLSCFPVLSRLSCRTPNTGRGLHFPFTPASASWLNLVILHVAFHGMECPLLLGTVNNKTPFTGINLSVSSLSHLYQLRPRHKSFTPNSFLFSSSPSSSPFSEAKFSSFFVFLTWFSLLHAEIWFLCSSSLIHASLAIWDLENGYWLVVGGTICCSQGSLCLGTIPCRLQVLSYLSWALLQFSLFLIVLNENLEYFQATTKSKDAFPLCLVLLRSCYGYCLHLNVPSWAMVHPAK